ncbi:MAG: M23 family metallopeptidase [Pseudomonadota bacterium]
MAQPEHVGVDLKRVNKQLNSGLLSAAFLTLTCIAGSGGLGWLVGVSDYGAPARDFAQTQISRSFSADAAVHPIVAEPIILSVDFQTDMPNLAAISQSGTLRRNSTLNATLERLGADPQDAASALNALYDAELLNPRRLQAGLKVSADFDENSGALIAISLRPESEVGLISKRQIDGSFFATSLNTKLVPQHRRISTTIDGSIYQTALAEGATDQQVADFAQIFAYDIDFQREIHPGDAFEIVYEAFEDERGNQVRTGEVLFAALNGKALTRGFYRHTPEDTGNPDYFTHEGKSATRFLMKTPINGARLSSGFGRRRHPISGYSRLHKGTDFAAPTGTPIFAAGNGVVERASRYGGYGHYVRIRHANGYKTAYAHLSRYGPSIRSGRRVRQGDVIGYVGSTGASTGPHLHYEVMVNGRHVNAMTLRLPTGRTLEGNLLTDFEVTRDEVDRMRARLEAPAVDVAAAPIAENG